MASGVPYLGAPFMAFFVRRFSKFRTHLIWMGWPLCLIGLLASSFADTVTGLIITQGIIYGGQCSISHVQIHRLLSLSLSAC